MTGPEVRARLHTLAAQHGIPELSILADELKRRPPAQPRVRTECQPLTQEQTDEAEFMYFVLNMPMFIIAAKFNTNTGRVSEAINGKRT